MSTATDKQAKPNMGKAFITILVTALIIMFLSSVADSVFYANCKTDWTVALVKPVLEGIGFALVAALARWLINIVR